VPKLQGKGEDQGIWIATSAKLRSAWVKHNPPLDDTPSQRIHKRFLFLASASLVYMDGAQTWLFFLLLCSSCGVARIKKKLDWLIPAGTRHGSGGTETVFDSPTTGWRDLFNIHSLPYIASPH
jgi:hypothetical protein